MANEVPREPLSDEVRAQFLRPGQLLSAQDAFPVAYVPIGTLEWHGRQNPIGCDAIKAERVCVETARRTGGVVMPPLYFSTDSYFDAGTGLDLGMDAPAGFKLPGSFYRIPEELFYNLLRAACANYLERGFEMVILVTGHTPRVQLDTLSRVCYDFATVEGRYPVRWFTDWSGAGDEVKSVADHAAGYETSMMLFHCPQCVNMRANDNQARPGLSTAGPTPWDSAAQSKGARWFSMQVEGFARLVKSCYAQLKGEQE